MNFQQLKYFTVLCEYKNFSKAAESLFISQQGLSTAIASLEAEFETSFFIRSPNGLILTEDGQYFFAWSQDILARVSECGKHFMGKGEQREIIKCAITYGATCEFAGELIKNFENAYPGLLVQLREYKDHHCDAAVDVGEADIGFGNEPLNADKFEFHRVFSCKQVCLVHKEHPWTKYSRLPVSLLPEETLITVDEDFKPVDMLLGMCRARGVHVEPKIRVGEVAAVHRLVRKNYGVGITTVSVAQDFATPNTVWREFEDIDPTYHIAVFRKKDMPLTRCSRIFYDYVLREMVYRQWRASEYNASENHV